MSQEKRDLIIGINWENIKYFFQFDQSSVTTFYFFKISVKNEKPSLSFFFFRIQEKKIKNKNSKIEPVYIYCFQI